MAARRVVRIVEGMDTSDGGGVRPRRTIGGPDVDHIDPFLLLDEFKSDERDDYVAGFPDHPHRGFATGHLHARRGEGTAVPRGSLAVLDAEGDAAVARAGDGGTKLLLVAGRPIGEPVARYGPFVMNPRARRSCRHSRTPAPGASPERGRGPVVAAPRPVL